MAKVFITDYDYQADIKVFMTDYDYKADLLFYSIRKNTTTMQKVMKDGILLTMTIRLQSKYFL